MKSVSLNNNMIDFLLKNLDVAALRHRVTANNVANVNTPGFQKSTVCFEEKLKKTLNSEKIGLVTTNSAHFPIGKGGSNQPEVIKTDGTTQRQDGNNVNLEKELSTMDMNAIIYRLMVQELNNRLGNLSYVINEGRR
ncbi:MAG: flagellar basal body rod protein FlgB [Bacillota bacterium]|jgi:flagellar basal-body rod protein FlgB